ncbi:MULTISPECIES: ABC transporter substrate-binding protein [unclassified Oceanispirochaeta]|uniref:ABC transporter substrate-binding protein n=1 Tax=unclassified Oceanispirochaeta TaxID=2635722 RepID=UPI000E09D67B|nr:MULTISPECIES: hypothetical protein [unclassified Oceanispirochaeta]MBF9018882.1 hypothetical protein [Oceanispirochaeta sp. M2]NPD75385.1 hypothetical protein [Oceanispirochaeta sp. M1]RDG28767.1 hypothetical protein DV872_25145 [Oceanispirochaeta sp. M1]
MKRLQAVVLILIGSLSPLSAGGQAESNSEKIRIGVMPDAGALPLLLMEDVEVLPFMSARNRDAALMAGELDGMMSDLVSVIHFNQNSIAVKVLTLTESRFMIVASPEFTKESPWTIGISENTVIEYMVDALVPYQELDKVAIPSVPVRMEMLRNGQLPMACLSDALAWPLIQDGFQVVRDQINTDLTPAVLVLTQDFLDREPKQLKALTNAWNVAVGEINENPENYRNLLLEQVRLPANDGYPIPLFREITLPGERAVESVFTWYSAKYGSLVGVDFKDMVIY